MRISDWSSDVCSSDLAGVALVVAVLLAAGFVLWQLRFVDEPPGTFDPVVAVAPAVLLSTVGILTVALFAPFSRAVSVIAARRPALAPALPARQASRRGALSRVAGLASTAWRASVGTYV